MQQELLLAITILTSTNNNKTPGGVNVGLIGTHSPFGPLIRGQ